MDLNKVMLIGRLTKKPELRTTPTGQNVTTFTVATNRSFLDASKQRQEKAEFHTIVAWGKLAEICAQFLDKGRRAFIEGRLQTREWTGQDGSRRWTTETIADNMIMLDSRPGGGSGEGGRNYPLDEQDPSGPSSSLGAHAQEQENEERTIEEIPF